MSEAMTDHLLAIDKGLRTALAALEKAQARIAALEAALEPFADVDGEGDENFADDEKVIVKFGRTTHYALRLRDFRQARAAYRGVEMVPNDGGPSDA